MELLTLAALGAGGYWLYTKARSAESVHPFQPVTGGVTKKPWKTRVVGIEGAGAAKKTTVEVWAPAGSWGPHLDLLVTTYQQTGSDKNSRVSLGTGPNALPEMVTAAGQDFAIKKPPTTVSGSPDHVVPLLVSGQRVGHVEVSHGGDHYDWRAQVSGSVISGVAPTVGGAVTSAIVGAKKKGGPLSTMGWPLVKFDPKTGRPVPKGTAMNPVTGKIYPDTRAGYRKAATDFNTFKE